MRYLLAYKADPNALTLSDRSSPILLTLKNMDEIREPRILHKLLMHGADKNLRDACDEGWLEYL